MAYALWLYTFLLVSFGLGALYGKARANRAFRIMCAPGFLAVALLRALAAALAGLKIGKVHPFSGETTVDVDEGNLSFVQHVVLGLVPFAGIFIIVYLVTWLMGDSVTAGYEARKMPHEFEGFADMMVKVATYFVKSFFDLFPRVPGWIVKALARGDVKALLWLYCTGSFLLAMPPRKADFKFTAAGLLVIVVPVILLESIGFGFNRAGRNFEREVWNVLSLATAMTVYILIATLAGAGGFQVFKTFAKDEKSDGKKKKK